MLDSLQYNLEELYEKNIEQLFTLSTRIFFQTHLHPMLRLHGSANEIFISLMAKDRTDVPVLLNASKAVMADEDVYIFACITVNQRRKYEDEILQAKRAAEDALNKNEELLKAKQQLEQGQEELDKQMSQLLYRNNELVQLSDLVAHDLQEPVRKISVYGGEVLRDAGNVLTERSQAHLNTVMRSTIKMKDVLRSLQDYMYISSHQGTVELVDLHKVVLNQLNVISNQFPDVACKADVEILPKIPGVAVQLNMLFYQLLKNAFVFKKPEGQLHISISGSMIKENVFYATKEKYRYTDHVSITIQDNGEGFDPKMGDHIFKMFKKASTHQVGLGVGLAICKRIVENHRGKINAYSHPGEGATFRIILPI
ncbi:sensor histidine kinase [Aridibaculum aurantiacum]|uniref:sensor histidine kinase n=1 Tax=Aridibaculum aurantiacum TaxID=2810307 RepID=UPI001A96F633|nr:ATP-binding protein [Aridibaculum aurantiacum]